MCVCIEKHRFHPGKRAAGGRLPPPDLESDRENLNPKTTPPLPIAV
jgi:hypothetical protein